MEPANIGTTLANLFPWTSTPITLEFGVSSALGITGEVMSFLVSSPLMVVLLGFGLASSGIGIFRRARRAVR